jgi:hypothetical protein
MFAVSRATLAPEALGLHIDDAKGLLAAGQERTVDEPVRTEVAG